MNHCIARVPYLNSAPFFRGLRLGPSYTVSDGTPSELGRRAGAGELLAGLLPLADYLRLRETYERLGRFGIAVRGRARSVLLFSRVPLRQLGGAAITVTQETSTTAVLLRLLLERRYRLAPASYQRGEGVERDALLLIGDEALRFQSANTWYPYETDMALEWWLWQHLPCVFAVWAIRKDADAEQKRQVEAALSGTLALNKQDLPGLAHARAGALGSSADSLTAYLSRFIYRFGQEEEAGLQRFEALAHESGLL